MRGLNGKTVIVTGGGGGIGRAVCQRFAEEGSLVAVLDRDEHAAQATVDLITEAGGKAKAYAADITDYAAITDTVAAIENDLGVPTVLVNNAGFDRFMPFLKTEPKLWDQLIAVNLTGALNMHHVVLPKMIAAGGGKVINVASDAARGPGAGHQERVPERGLPRSHRHRPAQRRGRYRPEPGKAAGGLPQRGPHETPGATGRLPRRHRPARQ